MKTEAEELARDCKMLRTYMISELPEGWTREVDDNYQIVYYDHVNKEATYEHPLTLEFRRKFHKVYKLQQNRRANSNPNINFRKDSDAEFANAISNINSNAHINVDKSAYK